MSKASLREDISRIIEEKREALGGTFAGEEFVMEAATAAAGPQSVRLEAARAQLPGYLDHDQHRPPSGTRLVGFVRGMLFVAAVTEVESAISGVAEAVLRAFPDKLKKSHFTIENVLHMSHRAILDKLVQDELTGLFYAKPADYWDRMEELVSLPRASFSDARTTFIEAKATRDLAVHNEWRSNRHYLEKAGLAKRDGYGESEWLHPDHAYFVRFIQSMDTFLGELAKHCETQFSAYGKGQQFRAMWNASSLASVVSFDKMWTLDSKNDVVRQPNFSWGWSSSEELLVGFFERVFHGRPVSEEANVWIDRLEQRLRPSDMRIVWEWLAEPFYF